MTLFTDLFEEEHFISGEFVAPGNYKQVETNRTVHIDNAGYLPESADGKMCSYFRVNTSDAIGRPPESFTTDTSTQTAA